jgi:hypothetical protein
MREDDDHFAGAFDDHGEIVAYFETFESFVDYDVLNLGCRDESCHRALEEVRRARRCLDPQSTQYKQ